MKVIAKILALGMAFSTFAGKSLEDVNVQGWVYVGRDNLSEKVE